MELKAIYEELVKAIQANIYLLLCCINTIYSYDYYNETIVVIVKL